MKKERKIFSKFKIKISAKKINSSWNMYQRLYQSSITNWVLVEIKNWGTFSLKIFSTNYLLGYTVLYGVK